jgi:hypothetical protein
MTSPVAVVPDTALRQAQDVGGLPNDDADIRWRAWKARGIEQDRRTTTIIRRTVILSAITFAIWLFVQFA